MRMVNRLSSQSGEITSAVPVRDRDPAVAAPPHRLRDPADRAVPAPDRRQNIATVPALLGWAKGTGRDAGRRAARPGRARAELPSAIRPALRRPAAAGRRRPRARRRPAGDADGRALRRDRPDHPRALQNEFLRLQAESARRSSSSPTTSTRRSSSATGSRSSGGRHPRPVRAPAEILRPADDFVADFIGGDRTLKRLALMRVRDIDLWESSPRPRRPVEAPRGEGEARKAPRSPTRSSSTPKRRPLGWLTDSDLAKRRPFPSRPDTSPDPVLDLDDVMRDALSDLLQS